MFCIRFDLVSHRSHILSIQKNNERRIFILENHNIKMGYIYKFQVQDIGPDEVGIDKYFTASVASAGIFDLFISQKFDKLASSFLFCQIQFF
ncbi:hypothetical protein BpHYR1_019982 [Brachionus plicatilis]|uniref:Uncharacterized protein n=1 Tax=Brachionus plicatilis TaxID=10195 RepID=A0A3M7SBK3_BRAPC|nr:hypothetical protein BpHYR1_019982 [Brachionus plicatilis]